MILFDRHERCFGIRLFKSSRRFVQLWICPSGYEIKAHSHPHEHIELMYLFGDTTFFRRYDNTVFEERFKPKWYHVFRRFTIEPGVVHWFKVSKLPLIFVNFATFTDGHKPTSAAVDFLEV